MNLIEQFKEKIRNHPPRIVYPEGDDERIIRAALQVLDEGIAEPVLVGDPGEVEETDRRAGLDPERIEVVSPQESG